MRLIFKVLSFMPLAILHALGWGLGWLVYGLSPTYRARLRANSALAGISEQARRRAVGAAGELVAELPRIWSQASFPVVWDGAALIDQALIERKGILFLTPHLGCFEATARAYAAIYGVAGHPMTVLFRPPRQTWLRSLVVSSRARPGLKTAPTTLAGVKQLVRALKSGECVGLLPDQVPPKGLGEWAPFFGKDAYTMTLAIRLAQQTGAAVLIAWGERLAWGRGYRIHVQRMDAFGPAALPTALQQMNAAMESLILQAPQQYLWGYARYKTPRETAI